ncbi:M7GpppX diphosphatase [Aphelenchoides fujianensis]|nr:M7GpppX diphosphatase [Aphelenchoides fujianensis]
MCDCKKDVGKSAEYECEQCLVFKQFSNHKDFKFVRITGRDSTEKKCLISIQHVPSQEYGMGFLAPVFWLSNYRDAKRDPGHINGREVAQLLQELQVVKSERNAEYEHLDLKVPTEQNKMHLFVIFPAKGPKSERADEAFRKIERVNQGMIVFTETAEIYRTFHEPKIKEIDKTWLDERIKAGSYDFKLVDCRDPNLSFYWTEDEKARRMKWKQDIHFFASPLREGLRSIRDLTAEHLPLLETIHSRGLKMLQEEHGVAPSQVNVYLHYPPSTYRLHVHFFKIPQYKRCKQAGTNFFPASGDWYDGKRGIPLAEVIGNIRLMPDFYQRISLQLTLFYDSPLLEVFKEAGVIKGNVKDDADISEQLQNAHIG